MEVKTRHTVSQKTTSQLLDYYLIPELLGGRPEGYVHRVQGQVASHNIQVTKSRIYTRANHILKGEGTIQPCAEFHGVPGKRDGKDMNYAGFWSLVDIFLPDKTQRHYLGLPSNQIDTVREHIGGTFIACETNPAHFVLMMRLAEFIMETKGRQPTLHVHYNDIFELMQKIANQKEFHGWINVLDLDLMQSLPEQTKLDKWAKIIRDMMGRKSTMVINLTATIGRTITEAEHNERTKYFMNVLVNEGLREIGHSRFAYRDRQIPMRAERMILKSR